MSKVKQILQWLILGSKGGDTRKQIILTLAKKPMNANALSKKLSFDYKTIQHHLLILEKNELITKVGNKYGQVYFISGELEDNFDLFKKLIGGND
jgi:predicted transcriptional regulator